MVYKSIDIIKFLMALFVVTIHCYVIDSIHLDWTKRICTSIIYSAVPFFYVTSSYLLSRHIQYDIKQGIINHTIFKSKVHKYWYHIAKMYILWFSIYHLKDIINLFIHPLESITNIVNDFFFWGSGHLWYLWGLLLILPIIYYFLQYTRPFILVIIGLGLICIFRLYSHFGSVENPTWWQIPLAYMWKGHIFNIYGIFYAYAFISVGVFMSTTEKWKNLSNAHLYTILIIGFIICCIDTGSVSIGYQPVAFALVALCLRWNVKSESFFLKYCRDVSTYIYLVHILVISLSHKISDNSIIRWIFTLTISTIIALLISILKKKQHTKN